MPEGDGSAKIAEIESRKTASKIPCPACGGPRLGVTDSRVSSKFDKPTLRRRRLCVDCDHRWTTYEVTEEDLSQWGNQKAISIRMQRVMDRMIEEIEREFSDGNL